MPHVPASYSSLSPAALASLIAQQYGLTNVHCQFLLRGVGDTYLVETGDSKFILRVYRSNVRTEPEIKEEVALLLALQEAGVSVACPIADNTGSAIQIVDAVEGRRCAVLFSYAPGTSVHILTERQLHSLGREMARFHNVSATLNLGGNRWEITLNTTLYRPIEMLKGAFSEDAETYAWLKQSAKRIEQKLAELNTAEFSKGYCHYDMLPKNFHFQGDAVTFFDFDFMGYGWLANDLMTFWQQLCLDVHFGKMTQDAADKAFAIFVAAYREIRPLSEQELAAVPYLSLGFWVYYSSFHTTHDQFYTFVQPVPLKVRFAFVRKMMEKYWL